ncbi:acyltransferase family protein [Pedomonas mirosovicensis]|uniref:acyltransferase family protein n=1 Tax=Pedomonas mirosovicensis TaxID=2908641 RepID=UPI00216A9693|nr:acyltransferase [Pedomonas mirosovicensis]MCH8685927.1 acyltransferase [Pedomonas mirosovicensis]
MHYRPEIDGLRAVAVIPVILFHAGLSLFSGGFAGVDVFFVISGYLITSIIINELEEGRFSIVRFYERRARRILPALFVVMLCCIPFAAAWMLPWQFKDFAQSLIAVTLFSSNILFWREDDYFATAAEEKPLLHTWSLAVEEQYYLLFPLLLALLWRFGRRPVFGVIALLAGASLLLSEYGSRHWGSANFYLAHTRAWELLIGSICAFLQFRQPQRRSNGLSALGLGLILFAIFRYDETTPFPSVYALAPTLGTALVILYGAGGTWAGRLLATRPFVGIGLISYSAYLWHQPLLAFARIYSLKTPPIEMMLALSAASLVLAYLSWKYVETPFRNRRAFSRGAIFRSAAATPSL